MTIRQPKLEPDQRLSDENLEADQRTDMHIRTHTSERVQRLVVTVSDHSVSDGSLGSVSPASSHSDSRPHSHFQACKCTRLGVSCTHLETPTSKFVECAIAAPSA
jgi:hypothetical protein